MVWRYENVIKPALNEGNVVLCDRYYYTSYVRDQLRGMKKEVLDKIYEGCSQPDLVLHFDVPPRLAVERLLSGKGIKHYSAGMDLNYSTNLEECASIYEGNMAKVYDVLLPKIENYHRINTERSIGEIFREVAGLVKEKIKPHKKAV